MSFINKYKHWIDQEMVEVYDFNRNFFTFIEDSNSFIDDYNISFSADLNGGTKILDASIGSRKLNLSPNTTVIYATADLDLTAANQDVPGATYTLNLTGNALTNPIALVEGNFFFDAYDTASGSQIGELDFNGAIQTGQALASHASASNQARIATQIWKVALTANASNTLKLQARSTADTAIEFVRSVNTSLRVKVFYS